MNNIIVNLVSEKLGKIALLLGIVAASLMVSCLPDQVSGPEPCNEDSTLLQDDFSGEKNCGWILYNGRGVTSVIQEGKLQISNSLSGEISWSVADRSFDDVIITTQARQVEGPNDNAYGIICRYQSPDNFYVFLISGDGYYAIGKYQSGSPQIQYLTGEGQYVYSDAINQGTATNEIKASCVGNELSLSVNGIALESITDPTFVNGDIGLGASTFQPGTTVIEFDSIRAIAP